MYEVTRSIVSFSLLLILNTFKIFFYFLALLDSADLPKVGMFYFRGRTVCLFQSLCFVLFK